MRTYLEAITHDDFESRFNYLKLNGVVAHSTFGYDRYLNQTFYASKEWKKIRNQVIIRDNACDLGIPDRPIKGRVIIHHINPITAEDIEKRNPIIFDLNNLICVSHDTHEALHYSNMSILEKDWTARKENDTCPWK